MRRRLRTLDGRVLAGVAVLVFFAVLLSFRGVTGATPWPTVGVEPGDLSFADLRSVTSSWDCERRGISAFPSNPCDPFHRPANYPRIWTQAGRLGLGQADTVPIGVAIGVIFFVAALAAAGPLTLGEGAVYGAALLAPATLLGVERGNVDLLMFALVVLGTLLVRRSAWLGAAPIALAAVLKIFPGFALALLLRKRLRWPAAAGALVVLLVYGIATLADIRTLRSVIPRETVNSYGAGVVVQSLPLARGSWNESAAEGRDASRASRHALELSRTRTQSCGPSACFVRQLTEGTGRWRPVRKSLRFGRSSANVGIRQMFGGIGGPVLSQNQPRKRICRSQNVNGRF